MNITKCILCGSEKFDKGIVTESVYMSSVKVSFWRFNSGYSNNEAFVCLGCGFIYEGLNEKALDQLRKLHDLKSHSIK